MEAAMPLSPRRPSRFRALSAAVTVVAAVISLGACATERSPAPSNRPAASRVLPVADPAAAIRQQAVAAQQEADKAAAAAERRNAPSPSAPGEGEPSPGQKDAQRCTTAPEDRAACRMPDGARPQEDGGDVDGDGVFEQHEPVGPGYKDPRAYDGGKTSGEIQCDYMRQQGYDC